MDKLEGGEGKIDNQKEFVPSGKDALLNLETSVCLDGLKRKLPSCLEDDSTREDSDFLKFLKEKNIIPSEDSIVYYVPIEDGNGNVVKYDTVILSKDNKSEIIDLPIRDLNGNILRVKKIIRGFGLETPTIDPIDFVCLAGGIIKGTFKGFMKNFFRSGVRLKVKQVSKLSALSSTLMTEIPKELVLQLITNSGD